MSHENLPQSAPGVTRRETPSQAARRVGAAKVVFDAIRLPYALQTAAVARFDEVRWSAIGREPGTPCSGAVLIAPKGTGKTEACRTLVRHAATEVPDGQKRVPVLHVSIEVEGTTGSVPTAILAALKEPRPDLGKEGVRWSKAVARLQRHGVELVLFDEFNRAGRRPTMSGPIALSIREKLLDPGICPVIIVGSEGANKVLANAPALLEVLDEQIDLDPLDWEIAEDAELFTDFVKRLDARLVCIGLLPEVSGLDDEEVARRLWEASSGRIRRLMKIVRFALGRALHDSAPAIDRSHLAAAVEAYAMRARLISHNPFDGGQ